MADLYVCPLCNETEDCACDDLDEALKKHKDTIVEVEDQLGALMIAIILAAPVPCENCRKLPGGAGNHCDLCRKIHSAKLKIDATRRALGKGG